MRKRWMLLGGLMVGVVAGLAGGKPSSKRALETGSISPTATVSVPKRDDDAARAAPLTGMARIDGPAFGCASRDDLLQLIRLQVDGDHLAVRRMLLPLVAQGLCRVMVDGEEVHLAETALLAGLAAVRPPGHPVAYWLEMERVKTR